MARSYMWHTPVRVAHSYVAPLMWHTLTSKACITCMWVLQIHVLAIMCVHFPSATPGKHNVCTPPQCTPSWNQHP